METTVAPARSSRPRMTSKSPPGSITSALLLAGSTRMEQLQPRGPTGKVSISTGGDFTCAYRHPDRFRSRVMTMEPQGFQNLTPFAAETLLLLDEQGAQVVTLVAKATYTIAEGSLVLADEQAPIVKAPVYHGAPGTSSLK